MVGIDLPKVDPLPAAPDTAHDFLQPTQGLPVASLYKWCVPDTKGRCTLLKVHGDRKPILKPDNPYTPQSVKDLHP